MVFTVRKTDISVGVLYSSEDLIATLYLWTKAGLVDSFCAYIMITMIMITVGNFITMMELQIQKWLWLVFAVTPYKGVVSFMIKLTHWLSVYKVFGTFY